MPSSRLPPLNPLRAFEAAARHRSVTAAAAELNVTHGAVSHQIRALEAALGVRLLERGGKRLRLTAHGAILMPAVTGAFEDIAAATARMMRPTTSGDLAISCVPALLSFWLLPRLPRFTALYPGIRLKLVPTNDPAEIYGTRVDVSILYGDGAWTDCWVKPWTDLELFPVVSPTLLNTQPLRTIRDLGNLVLLHADDGREWHTWLASADALDLARGPHHFMSDARLAIEAAVHGSGVALGDTMTASGLLARGSLVVPFDHAVPAVDSFHVACRTEAMAAPIVKVFVDWLYAALEEEDARTDVPAAGQRAVRRRRANTGPSLDKPAA